MNKVREQIIQGRQALSHYEETLQKINELIETKDDKMMLEFLMDMQKMEFEGRILSTKTALARLQKDDTILFEKESAEANFYMQDVLDHAMKYVGKEPKAITDKIIPLVQKYVPFMAQEHKNEIYFELKSHIDFLTNKYNKK